MSTSDKASSDFAAFIALIYTTYSQLHAPKQSWQKSQNSTSG